MNSIPRPDFFENTPLFDRSQSLIMKAPQSAPQEIQRTKSNIAAEVTTPISAKKTAKNKVETPSPVKIGEKDTPTDIGAKAYMRLHEYITTPPDKSTTLLQSFEKHERAKKLKKLRKSVNKQSETDPLLSQLQENNQSNVYNIQADDHTYIGKDGKLGAECNAYAGKYRRKEKTPLNQKLEIAFAENKPVKYGFIYLGVPKKLLAKVEKFTIALKKYKLAKQNKLHRLLNRRAGGGGGAEKKPFSEQDYYTILEITQKAYENLKNNTHDAHMNKKPIRFFVNHRGEVKPDYSNHPRSPNTKNVIYDYYDTKTKKHYIGKTITALKQRVSSEMTFVNNPNNPIYKNKIAPWQKAIKARPQDFELRILGTLAPEQGHLAEELEHSNILIFNSHNNGYNGNSSSAHFSKKNIKKIEKAHPHLKETVQKIRQLYKAIIKHHKNK